MTEELPPADKDTAEVVARVLLALDHCQGGEEMFARHESVCLPFHDRAQQFLTDDVLDALDRLREEQTTIALPGATS